MYDLRELVSVGRSAKVSRLVKESDTATSYSKGLEEFLATTVVIGMGIQASALAIDQYLPEGYISIGREIEFEHFASTMQGVRVTVEATVIEVQSQYMVLEIKAVDEAGEIGRGKHRRSIVKIEYLLARAAKRNALSMNKRLAEDGAAI